MFFDPYYRFPKEETIRIIFDINDIYNQVHNVLMGDELTDLEKHRLVIAIQERFPTEWDIFKNDILCGHDKTIAVAFEIKRG